MERPDKSVSRYDKSWQEYANFLESARDFLEQKLELLTKRLEEIEADATRRYDIANTAGVGWAQDIASAERRIVQELLKELNQ